MESSQAQGREVASDADAIVRITRSPSYAGRLRAYRILVDGREAGRVTAGLSVEISVSRGPTRLSRRLTGAEATRSTSTLERACPLASNAPVTCKVPGYFSR